MRKITRIDMFCATAVAIILAQVSPTLAADYDVGSIHIAQPWSRATPRPRFYMPARNGDSRFAPRR